MIYYRKCQHFQLAVPASYKSSIITDTDIVSPDGIFGKTAEGLFWVNTGYTFQPSGPTFKTKSFIRGSLFHDVGYSLMELGLLPMSFKSQIDDMLIDICLDDGMWKIRTNWIYEGLEHFGRVGYSKCPILTAP